MFARLAAVGVGVFFVFIAPVEQLMPTVAEEHGMTAAAIGLFLAAPGMIELAITPRHGILIDLMGAMLIGFGWEFVFVGGQTTVAIEVPPTVRGRMMGIFFVLVTATTALGAVMLGVPINELGMVTAFLLTAGAVVLAGVMLLTVGPRSTGSTAPVVPGR